ncbi:unnamed protein product [Lactuca virosa]|uniref:Fatty acid desaturase domain-containing protein n=1 Tax=Lactuca virosa TaxID=75947 RepID=A0AAU9N6Y5_9ASTR|nr:unnamed protein product [Lactuca virosa]
MDMSAGGQMSKPSKGSKNYDEEPLQRAPYKKPPFTIGDLKKAIPPHCFNRSILRSFSYLLYDLTISFIMYYLASRGVWVIAHECGHHAFSNYQWVDDTVGFLLHSSLLVPYFSWKYSHRRHHSNTASLERDEVFVPKLKSNLPSLVVYLNNPPGRVLYILFVHTLGWPLYLMFNYAGRNYDRVACHFYPNSPIYSKSERAQIIVSDFGVVVVTYLLYNLVMTKGLTCVFCMYGVPMLILNTSLICVTYLHHTHSSLPHYDSTEWDWLRGALATVDRDYGILNIYNRPQHH